MISIFFPGNRRWREFLRSEWVHDYIEGERKKFAGCDSLGVLNGEATVNIGIHRESHGCLPGIYKRCLISSYGGA